MRDPDYASAAKAAADADNVAFRGPAMVSNSNRVFITDRKTVAEQQMKGEYSIPSLDGGTIVTGFDNFDTDKDPFVFDLVSQKNAADGSLGPELVLLHESVATGASFADVAVSGGGVVYALDFRQDRGGYVQRTLELDYITASGQDTRTTLDVFGIGDTPLPTLYPSEPVLTHYSNATFSVSWTDQYSAGDPKSGPYDTPTTTESFVRIYADDGTLISTTTVGFDGARLSNTYGSDGKLVQSQLKTTDGTNAFLYFDPTTGKETGEYIRYADGSRTNVNLVVTGKSYAAQADSYDAHGKLLSMTRLYANGGTAFTQVNNPDGTGAVANYDTRGRETTSIASAADGSRDVVMRSYAGASTAPSTVEAVHYGAGNQKLSDNTTLADGSHTQVAFAAGVTLTSTPTVQDTFTSSSAGRDTFVFKPTFGQDIITNFHAGSGANHDVADFTAFHVQLGSPQSQADYLAQHLKQVGSAAVLTITPTETITLKNTLAASLTRENVLI